MNNLKWLMRKFPESYKHLIQFVDYDYKYSDHGESYCKSLKQYKFGKLIKDVSTVDGSVYQKGCYIIFKRTNPINDYNYPDIFAIAKCDLNITSSGFHVLRVFKSDIREILK